MKPSITHLMLGMFLLWAACKNPEAEKTSAEEGVAAAIDTTTAVTNATPPMDSAAMEKAWEDFMTPGDMHTLMGSWAGQWDGEISTWFYPSQPPEKSVATNILSPVMSGLYQTGHMTGTMMGHHYEGKSLMGYDNAKKMFVSTWVDNMGSGIVYMTGTWDDASKTLHMKGFQTDPVTGKDAAIREELKIIDDNNHIMSMYMNGTDGKEMKFMEANFRRH